LFLPPAAVLGLPSALLGLNARGLNALVLNALVLTALLSPMPAAAQAGAVYRCPGPPVLYTDALRAEEARDRGCRTIEGAPITVIQATKPRPAAAAAAAVAGSGASVARSGEAKVDPAAQRQRDGDARRILEAELKREEDKLVVQRREYNNGEPERRGEERNFQRYLDRVADMKAGIARTESDIAALKREMTKLAS
jgi:Xaa-Pro aminopeptidase